MMFAYAADIDVSNVYAKATPPNAKNSGAFMLIKNNTDKDIALVSATNSLSDVTELHTHIEENGMKKMIQVPKIDIKANSTTELKPGGLHVMFIGIKKPMVVGENVKMTLTFDNGQTVTLDKVPVKEIKPIKMH
ncbi:copper chaperone PCu(A)C [Campylobacter sp. RM12327]|nr:copper chaperone PCu(A)C [Campylobacter sp. RM11302]MBF6668607.1 copper chaperone PCu(A)C [Campylobacter sp. RM12327]MBF6674137.1 copper chaperone PCu(A)C [Campylobacter sp. RM13538]MBF6675606.1 copper chaperone PCu(A)C [Campylobacter sp. RM12321]MBF6677436.1 copper chaperone PCu(A)C [Campylobacter sp. RM11259]